VHLPRMLRAMVSGATAALVGARPRRQARARRWLPVRLPRRRRRPPLARSQARCLVDAACAWQAPNAAAPPRPHEHLTTAWLSVFLPAPFNPPACCMLSSRQPPTATAGPFIEWLLPAGGPSRDCAWPCRAPPRLLHHTKSKRPAASCSHPCNGGGAQSASVAPTPFEPEWCARAAHACHCGRQAPRHAMTP
jgi:hypothetical protein